MNVEIISPQATLFNGKAKSVTVPSMMGPFTFLENHAPIVAILDKGIVTICNEDTSEKKEFEVLGGFVEEHDNNITICVEI